jgi:microcystin-dependent protein
MATVTGLTAERMLEIEAASVVDGDVVSGNLILTKHDGTQINAGGVVGPTGATGPTGPPGPTPTPGQMMIPGEIKMWPSSVLPELALYGLWTWANGGIFDVATYPKANSHIDPAWKTAMGLPDPGVGKFRVPDLRGLTPAGLDAMPVGSGRANRVARAVAIILAKNTGEEYHAVSVGEMPFHGHGGHIDPAGAHSHTPDINNDFLTGTRGGTTAALGSGGTARFIASNTRFNTNGVGDHAHGLTIDGAGGGGGHETMQPTIFVPYIVKLDD